MRPSAVRVLDSMRCALRHWHPAAAPKACPFFEPALAYLLKHAAFGHDGLHDAGEVELAARQAFRALKSRLFDQTTPVQPTPEMKERS